MNKQGPKFLLIQFRHEPKICNQEWRCFQRLSGLKKSQFTAHNALKDNIPSTETLDSYHAIILGGASGIYVSQSDQYPFINDCIN